MPSSFLSVRRRYTILLALLATLFQVEVDPTTWKHEEAGTFKRSRDDIFNYVIKPEEVHEVGGAEVAADEDNDDGVHGVFFFAVCPHLRSGGGGGLGALRGGEEVQNGLQRLPG